MKYEDFERAQELRGEISRLQDIAMTLQPNEYDEEAPVMISRVCVLDGYSPCNDYSDPVSIPADIARAISAMVWKLAEEKEKEFEKL